jgi:hypothetical protein
MGDTDLSSDEASARRKMIRLCEDIAQEYGEREEGE